MSDISMSVAPSGSCFRYSFCSPAKRASAPHIDFVAALSKNHRWDQRGCSEDNRTISDLRGSGFRTGWSKDPPGPAPAAQHNELRIVGTYDKECGSNTEGNSESSEFNGRSALGMKPLDRTQRIEAAPAVSATHRP